MSRKPGKPPKHKGSYAILRHTCEPPRCLAMKVKTSPDALETSPWRGARKRTLCRRLYRSHDCLLTLKSHLQQQSPGYRSYRVSEDRARIRAVHAGSRIAIAKIRGRLSYCYRSTMVRILSSWRQEYYRGVLSRIGVPSELPVSHRQGGRALFRMNPYFLERRGLTLLRLDVTGLECIGRSGL